MGRTHRTWLGAEMLATAVLVACSGSPPEDALGPTGAVAKPAAEFMPDADGFRASAARLLERSRQIRAGAHPDYQRDVLAALPPNPLNGPFHRLDDLLATARVRETALGADVGDDGTIFGFEFSDGDPAGFRASGGAMRVEQRGDMLHVVNDLNGYLATEGTLPAFDEAIGEIAIRMRCDAGKRMVLSWLLEFPDDESRARKQEPWARKLDVNLIADGDFHTYVIDAETSIALDLRPGARLATLLLKPSDGPAAKVEIDYVRFLSRYAKYAKQARGASTATLAGEWRSVLYLLPTQAIEYTLRIPETAPQLDFGIGVLFAAAPVTFEVRIAHGADETPIFREEVSDTVGWRDFRLDLAAYAGDEVRLTLRVRSAARNVAFFSNPIVHSARVRPFNVVLLLEDALRADRLSTQGYAVETSPNKTAFMKADGVLFTNAFSQATKTRPSIPALMTSLLPTATGVWNFANVLDDAYLTLAEILRSQGFVTSAFLQNSNAGPMAGLHQGFDEIRDAKYVENGPQGVMGEPVFAWLEKHRDRNFLLYLHSVDPHGAYDPPPPYDRVYRERGPGVQRVKRDVQYDPDWIPEPTAEGRSALYDGEIRHNDSLLPALLAKLDALGMRENTLFLMTADHGEFLGERGIWGHRPPGFSQVTHVPLMLAYPARFPGGRVIPQNAQLIDVLPTVLELAGIDPTQLLLFGDSLVGLIDGEQPDAWENRVSVSEEPLTFGPYMPTATGSFFFRDWHLISSRTFREHSQSRQAGLPERRELAVFNFRNDPSETAPIAPIPPELEQAYHASMRELQANNTEARAKWTLRTGEAVHRFDPEEVERLRELGYMR